ncbi:glucose-1-phosphate cytidylyltransferase [Leptospira fluminis]|uniref:Glucose-1-phosphate cytidylyltransferase n=1 Tax=Leptospira fluminis TaxID=2484979 RepID=A0A4R9GNP9_9LEPT|nr:glucose-1-phosphate cytidylyltransferase [Leptospira fluminis]TGK17276.1 glucose-1-phosphate cytidylyltransferase [Leptospira fluminis]
MKAVILCGGLGTRLSEETTVKPKPMVEIGGRPILWHVMKIYERYGINDFVLALGYKGEVIKDYFLNYHARMSDLTVQLKTGSVQYSNPTAEDWKVTLMETGPNTLTGGRLLRLKNLLEKEGTFLLTYGDGVSNVDISSLIRFHKSHGKIATVTAVRPPARFGGMGIQAGAVKEFKEKPQTGEGWINGGFFVFESKIFNYLADDSTILEQEPLENLVKDDQLMAYEHTGYWQCMDTVRDRDTLQNLYVSGRAPWV